MADRALFENLSDDDLRLVPDEIIDKLDQGGSLSDEDLLALPDDIIAKLDSQANKPRGFRGFAKRALEEFTTPLPDPLLEPKRKAQKLLKGTKFFPPGGPPPFLGPLNPDNELVLGILYPETQGELALDILGSAAAAKFARGVAAGAKAAGKTTAELVTGLADAIKKSPTLKKIDDTFRLLPKEQGKTGFQGQATYKQVKELGARRALENNILRASPIFEKARRGKISDTELLELAEATGLSREEVLALRAGDVLNAERALKAAMIEAESGHALAKFVKGMDLSDPVDTAKFIDDLASHTALQSKVVGVFSELGRALRTRKLSQLEEMEDLVLHPQIVDRLKGNPEKVSIIARALKESNIDNVRELRRTIRNLNRQHGLMDQLVEFSTAMKLTSPDTIGRNLTGNTMGLMLLTARRPFEAASDLILSKALGRKQEVFLGEAGAGSFAMLRAIPDAMKSTWDALLGRDAIKRLQEATRAGGAIPGAFGEAVRLPFRVALSGDRFFRVLLSQFQVNALAFREAKKAGLTGSDLWNKVDELIKAPSQDMLDAARKFADEGTFQDDLTGILKTIDEGRFKHPWTRFILPFFKTPANLFTFALRQTAAAPALEARRFLQASKTGDRGAQAAALAQSALGTINSVFMMNLAGMGVLTGDGPKSRRERESLQATGWRPNSVKINDTYYSYQGLEPFATVARLHANIAEEWLRTKGRGKGLSTALTKAMGQTVKGFGDQPFLLGMAGLVEAVRNPDHRLESFLAGLFGGSLIPAGSRFLARLQDPRQRAPGNIPGDLPSGVFQRMTSGLPEPVRSTVQKIADVPDAPFRFDPLGLPIVRHRIPGIGVEVSELAGRPSDFVQEFLAPGETLDSVRALKKALLDLNVSLPVVENRLQPGVVREAQIRADLGVDESAKLSFGLTPGDFQDFQILRGQEFRRLVRNFLIAQSRIPPGQRMSKRNLETAIDRFGRRATGIARVTFDGLIIAK